jgi:hypothetical protein
MKTFLATAAAIAMVTGLSTVAFSSPDAEDEATKRILQICNVEKLHPLAFTAVKNYFFGEKIHARQVTYYVAMLNPEVGRDREACIVSFGTKEKRKDNVYSYGYDPRHPIYTTPVEKGDIS